MVFSLSFVGQCIIILLCYIIDPLKKLTSVIESGWVIVQFYRLWYDDSVFCLRTLQHSGVYQVMASNPGQLNERHALYYSRASLMKNYTEWMRKATTKQRRQGRGTYGNKDKPRVPVVQVKTHKRRHIHVRHESEWKLWINNSNWISERKLIMTIFCSIHIYIMSIDKLLVVY